jgi:transcriptional regulator with XRE-family HTH domain
MSLNSIRTDRNSILLALLKECRHRQRLRQADVAARLGWTQATVSNVERGERRLEVIELHAWLWALEADFVDFMRRLNERLPAGYGMATRRGRPTAAENVASNSVHKVSERPKTTNR